MARFFVSPWDLSPPPPIPTWRGRARHVPRHTKNGRDTVTITPAARRAIIQGGRHRRDMERPGTTAPPDDPRPGVTRQTRIVGHGRGRRPITHLALVDKRHPAIALDRQVARWRRGGDVEDRVQRLGGADAAISAERVGCAVAGYSKPGEISWRHAHHGALMGVEAHRAHNRQAGRASGRHSGPDLGLVRHGFNP